MQNRRRRIFRGVAVAAGLCLALLLAEIGLRQWRRQMVNSDQLEPGFIRPDPKRGWKLSAGWTGRHQHHDFDVRYSVGPDGFRIDPNLATNSTAAARPIAVVGDSYTFGFGVEDPETFTSLLNREGSHRFLNFGVPGYSTDQELLLIEDEVLARRPDTVILVVYLGNDLLDNARSQPLQVAVPKPRFEQVGSELVLQAPSHPSALELASNDPAGAVLGSDSRYAWRQKIERASAAAGLISRQIPAPDLTEEFSERFPPLLDLFQALMDRLENSCRSQGVTLKLALLGNAALLDQPRSVSGQFQDYLRQEILRWAEARSIAVIDLSAALARRPSSGEPLFHPNEGHLTAAGHRAVADILAGAKGETTR